jgi:hypothetical protein
MNIALISNRGFLQQRISKTTLFILLFTLFAAIAISAEPNSSADDEWPRQFELDEAKITLYQPQIESFNNDKVEAYSALAIRVDDGEPLFAAMWFTSRIVTDQENRMMLFSEVKVKKIKIPEGEQTSQMTEANLTRKLSAIEFSISMDRFLADLEAIDIPVKGETGINNQPPAIYYETQPSILVPIDGDPILNEVENGYYQYVVNTPFIIVLDPNSNYFYLKGGKWWYRSQDIRTDWTPVEDPPKQINYIVEQSFSGESADEDTAVNSLQSAPKIIVSTVPAELIISDGNPRFSPIKGTQLLYMENSEDDILLDIKSQQYYVLVSGRWYTAKSMTGDKWAYVAADRLPPDFAKIPEDSSMASVRASVAGTQEAKEAILETVIPQTAKIDRATATVEVDYDGEPEFSNIENTGVAYALNSNKTVLRIKERYYVVDDGVWFEATSANGPWIVSTVVPDEVQAIPPSSPVYHVKYVYIYDYTPSVVYVGYTGGYHGCYIHHGAIIYGTGYYYRPWYRSRYYPRPLTYGFGVHYTPYTGWGFSVGISYGWISFSWTSDGYGYWGPRGYCYGYRHGYYHRHRHGYYHGYRNGYLYGFTAGRAPGYRPISKHSPQGRRAAANVYKNRRNGVIGVSVKQHVVSDRKNRRAPVRTTKARADNIIRSSQKHNNVYADNKGNIYRRENNGAWKKRQQGTWKNSDDRRHKKTTQRANEARSRNTVQTRRQTNGNDMERHHKARTRGARNSESYKRSRGSNPERRR